MASSAANKPSDIEAQYQGEVRSGDGYQYWTTSAEDEEAETIRDIVDKGEEAPATKAPKKKLFKPGAARRLGIRFASLLLISILAAAAWFIFNVTQVYSAADDVTTQPAQAIVVLGAAQYNGEPSGVLRERLDHAYDLSQDETLWIDGEAPVIMTTGAGAEGEVNTEGLAGYNYLNAKCENEDGESTCVVLAIPEGTNTYEQLSASLFQLEQLDDAAADNASADEADMLTPVILVSDGYHNARLLQIADELGMRSGNRGVFLSPQQIIEPTTANHLREAAAMSIGRITGFRRLSAFTESG